MSEMEMQVKKEETALSAPEIDAIRTAVEGIMRPVMSTLAEIMKENTKAVQYIAAQQQIQSERMEQLEKQMRLQTPVSNAQARLISGAVKEKAMRILDKYGLAEDKKAVKALCGHIKKAVLKRYGVSSIREIPKCEYGVAIEQVETWNDQMIVLEVKRNAKAEG